jgi:hypothetical protein
MRTRHIAASYYIAYVVVILCRKSVAVSTRSFRFKYMKTDSMVIINIPFPTCTILKQMLHLSELYLAYSQM